MAKSVGAERTVRVQIDVVNPPDVTGEGLEFGLQDKDQRLHDGVMQAGGSLRFECGLQVKPGADGKPNFLGVFAHGTADDRFLYLTWKQEGQITRRIKVKLVTITWTQVEAASAGGVLEASVDGRGTASVKLLGDGWQVASA
jgi:hypothetical protein